jgi:hypothetical protein
MVAEASAAAAQQQQASSSSSQQQGGADSERRADGQPRKEGEVLAILRETNEVSIILCRSDYSISMPVSLFSPSAFCSNFERA